MKLNRRPAGGSRELRCLQGLWEKLTLNERARGKKKQKLNFPTLQNKKFRHASFILALLPWQQVYTFITDTFMAVFALLYKYLYYMYYICLGF